MKNRIYIFQNGELKRKDNTLYFENEQGKKFIPIENTSEILIFGEVDVNKRFLEFATQAEIIIHFFNYYGYYIGSFYPREHYNSGYMILRQAEFYMDMTKRLSIARLFVRGATFNILRVLKYYQKRGKEVEDIIVVINDILKKTHLTDDANVLLGLEGNIRNMYYQAFEQITENTDFSFEKRSRRPPKNALNALISFGNSLLYVEVLREIYQTHLDPRIGYLHTTNFRSFTLNLDIAEIFKPIIVDRCIFNLLNKKMIKPKHFLKELNGVVLNEDGRKLFIQEYESRLKTTIKLSEAKDEVSYSRIIRRELYKLEKHLMGEKEYAPYVSGW
jgi:CRISPR-associated protein Cas1